MANELNEKDLTTEHWREYDFDGRVYRINMPQRLFYSDDGTTDQVLDAQGVVHCLPAPGERGCVLRWKSKDNRKPATF